MDTTAATIELQPAASPVPFSRTHVVAESDETSTLTLRPLKKHTNVRLGKKIDLTGYPSKTSLFTISNKHGWFFAGHEHAIRASPLSELRTSLAQNSTEEEIQFLCQVKLDLSPDLPLFLALAAEESKLVVASTSSVSIWDVNGIINGETTPTNTLKLNNLAIVDVLPNPGEIPEIVAFLTMGPSQDEPYTLLLYNCMTATEIVRWSGLMKKGNAPVSASWSSKGKQIAIGLSSGDIVQYSPSSPSEAKVTVPRVQGPDLQGTIPLALQWLSNTIFYVIYAQPRSEADLEEYEPTQYNYIISYDKKTNHAIDILLPLPWEPYGLQREPGHLVAGLRPWGVFKHLIFVNDAHANDVGIVACLGEANSSMDDSGRWVKVSLGEESLTFPLSSDMDDTSLVGMSVDLLATQKLLAAGQVNGDDPSIPPAPILYMMTNDAVIVAFHIVNEDGDPYPAMTGASSIDTVSMRGGTEQGMDIATEKNQDQGSTLMESERPPAAQPQVPSAFATSSPAPSFGQSGFGFGATAGAPKFGASGFGAGATTSPFATAASSSSPPAFKPSGPTLGFGAFASQKSTFGSSSFGAPSTQSPFGQSSFGSSTPSSASTSAFGASATTTNPPASTASSTGGFLAFAGPKPSFGQSSFGAATAQSAFGAATGGSAFGATGQSAFSAKEPSKEEPAAQPASNTTPAFKPAAGFGAFGGGGSSFGSSAFSSPKPIAFDGKATTFASGGTPSSSGTPFGGAPTTAPGPPKFGQSGFGQSKFGQSAFGQSGFGQTSFGGTKSAFAPPVSTTSSTTASGGGFGAFAGSATSFASLASQPADKTKPAFAETASADSKSSTFAKDTPTAFGTAKGGSNADTKKDVPKSISPFGSNTTVSKPGFGGSLRAKAGNDDEEDEDETASKEKFPEAEAEKLEPKEIFTGPGLFDSGSKSKGKDKEVTGLGQLGIRSGTQEESGGPPKIASAFQPVPPLSVAMKPKTPVKSTGQDQGSEKEESVDLEDDVNEFLSEEEENDEDLEEVDLTGELEVHEFDDEEEVEEDEEDEDEDDEEEEEEEDDEEDDAASVPDDASEELTPPASAKTPSKGPPSKAAATTGALFNPFGRKAAADIQPRQASQSPLSPPPHTAIKTQDAIKSIASNSASTSRPTSLADRLGPPVVQESPTRPKARPASPKTPFGTWGATGSTTQAQPPSAAPNPRANTPKPSLDNASRQTTGGKDTVTKAPPPEPEFRAIKPQHPEMQNHLDQILINYGLLINSINERAKKVRGAFDAFKAAASGASSIEGLPEPYRSMSLDRMRLALKEMNQTADSLKTKTFILQQGLLDLQGASLRAEMKREEASRYLAARKNPQFMENLVKPRGLGPEHTENRNKLRKSIQLQSERVKEVDEHIRRLKRKVELFKAGNMAYQPPNLDQVRNACQNIDLYISTANERIARLMARIDALPYDRHTGTDDNLQQSRGHPRRLSASFAVTRAPLSRTGSLDIAPETIATTVEVFAGEVKMTKLRDTLVHLRSAKPAPLIKVRSQSNQDSAKAGTANPPNPGLRRKDPFHKFKKPVSLKDMAMSKPSVISPQTPTHPGVPSPAPSKSPGGISFPQPASVSSSQGTSVVVTQPDPTPASSTTRASAASESIRRGGGSSSSGPSRHPKAVPINRDKQNIVQDTSFSFGPPPNMNQAVKVPANFVSLTAKKP